MTLISNNNPALLAKNKFVNDAITPLMKADKIDALFNTMDSVFKSPDMNNRLNAFNQKISSLNLAYTPYEAKTKYVGACTNCVTLTELVSRLCENYGCVQENLTTNYEATDCNSFSVTKINPTADLVTVQQIASSVAQNIRDVADPTQNCFTVPLVTINVKERLMRDAMCSCTALDALAEALLSIRNTIAKVIDRAILYGNYDTGTATYLPISNFDSIDNLIPAGQKLTANSELDLYKKITVAIANITGATGCGVDDISIIARSDVRVRMLGALDNNGRPIRSELAVAGVDCNSLIVACANVYSCQSTKWKNTAGVVTTDVFVGLKNDYAFSKYIFPAVEPQFDQQNGNSFTLFNETRFGGKLMNVNSFYKITATL